MQISFDPRDRSSATSALAMILALHPDIETPAADVTGPTIAEMIERGDLPAPGGRVAASFGARVVDDPADAAEAFGAGPTAQPVSNAVTAAAPGGSSATPSTAPVSTPTDSSGLPWDARIHSGPADTKPTNADGTWRKKRGVSDEEVVAVTAELRAGLGGAPIIPVAPVTEAPAAPVPPAPVAAPPPPPPAVATAPVPAPPAPAPSPAPADTGSGPAGAKPAVSTFAELMKKITGLQASGALSVEDTHANCTALGMSSIRDLISKPELIAAYDALLPEAG